MTTQENETPEQSAPAYDFSKLNFKAVYCGKTKRDDNWDCFAWRVSISNGKGKEFSTDFYCGMGHVVKVKGGMGRGVFYDDKKRAYFAPKPPTVEDVMHSLTLDMQAIEQSFYDWCMELGYEEDSRKALATYDQCCNIGRDLRGMFSRQELDAMRAALADY